ncbi:MAG: hypothetical protein ACR2JV_08680 [Gaiellales bacterium]
MHAYLETSRAWYVRVPAVWREAAIAALLCLAGALAVTLLLPPPDDASAHLYRALLVQRDAVLWDNFWYGGDYPLVSYSLLVYLPQQVIGPATLALVGVVGSAALFAVLVVQRWGERAAWGARAFGLLALGPLFTGGYAYAVGAAALLACLLALQRHRHLVGGILGAVTLGLSPLAFLFLALILGAVWLEHRRLDPRTFVVGAWLAGLVVVQAAIGFLFPSDGVYPFLIGHLLAVLGVSILGVALARRRPETHLIMWLLIAWAVGALVLYAIPTPVGDNLARLRYFVFPMLAVAAGVQRWRPRLLVALALIAAFAYGALPDLYDAVTRTDSRPTQPAFWQPAVAFLDAHPSPDYRVEVVQTAGRWEAFWIPKAGFALVRGWYRQVDLADNPVLYQKAITPLEYQAWLRSRAVRYVLLPRTKLDTEGARAESVLLRSGTSGLRIVARRGAWTIYELPRPTPLMTGPGTARILSQGHDELRGTVNQPGLYTLRVRWMPYWTLSGVVDCIQPGPEGQTVLRAISPGGFSLRATQRADLLVERMFDAPATDATCTP